MQSITFKKIKLKSTFRMKNFKDLKKNLSSMNNVKHEFKITQESEERGLAYFELVTRNNQKIFTGKVFIINDLINFHVDYTNYSDGYAKNKFNRVIKEMDLPVDEIDIEFHKPIFGDIITVLATNFDENTKFLVKNTRYHSINNNYLNCNGWLMPYDCEVNYYGKLFSHPCESYPRSQNNYFMFEITNENIL